MKALSWLTIIVVIFGFQGTYAGGSVNSGMGVAEMQFRHAYANLPTWISGCLLDPNSGCLERGSSVLDPNAFRIFTEVKRIAIMNRARENRLHFISATEDPEKFETGLHEKNRLASTQMQPDSDIFINVDLLYNDRGETVFTLDQIAAILVHEVGHQSGVADHEYLDDLGGRIRFYVDRSTKVREYRFGIQNELIQMAVTEQSSPAQFAQLLLTWGDQYVVNCTAKVAQLAKCADGRSLAGFELYNDFLIPNTTNRKLQVGMIYHFQLRLRCAGTAQLGDTIEEKEAEFYLFPDNQMNSYGAN